MMIAMCRGNFSGGMSARGSFIRCGSFSGTLGALQALGHPHRRDGRAVDEAVGSPRHDLVATCKVKRLGGQRGIKLQARQAVVLGAALELRKQCGPDPAPRVKRMHVDRVYLIE